MNPENPPVTPQDYYNAGNVNMTQDQNKPQTQEKTGTVLTDVQVRSTDRSPKNIGTWRQAIIAAESVYYPNHQRLYDLYTDIMQDGHLGGIIDKRIDAVLNKDIYFEAKAENGYERVDDMDILIQTEHFRDMMKEILLTKFWGRTGFEFIPGRSFSWLPIPRKHIKMKTQKITMEQTGLTEGIDYTQYANLWIMGKSADLGILSSVAQYALYKRGAFADWANYIELFGMPAWLFMYDAYDEQTKAALTKLINEVGSMLRVMLPKQATATPIDAKSSNGNGQLQELFYNACNAEMSIRVLTVTETTNSSKSSGHAQAKTHQEQQLEVTKSDIFYLRNYLNDPQFIAILKSYGYNVANGRFAFAKEANIAFMSQKWEIDMGLIQSGLPVGKKYLYETYDIPTPEPGEEVVTPLGTGAIDAEEEIEYPETEDDVQPKNKPGKKKKQPAAFLRGFRFFS